MVGVGDEDEVEELETEVCRCVFGILVWILIVDVVLDVGVQDRGPRLPLYIDISRLPPSMDKLKRPHGISWTSCAPCHIEAENDD